MRSALILTIAFLAPACSRLRPEPPPPAPPPPPPRVDTVTVIREVPPPLPHGAPIEICLSTGYPLHAVLSAAGDTLVGETRIPIAGLRPGIDFAGTYAAGRAWLTADRPIVFERRNFSRSGEPIVLRCEDLKAIGNHDGVTVFAMIDAQSPVEFVYVPIRPGLFQVFRAPRRR